MYHVIVDLHQRFTVVQIWIIMSQSMMKESDGI